MNLKYYKKSLKFKLTKKLINFEWTINWGKSIILRLRQNFVNVLKKGWKMSVSRPPKYHTNSVFWSRKNIDPACSSSRNMVNRKWNCERRGRGRPWLSHFQKDTTASALLPLKNQRTPNQLDVTGSKQFVLGSLQIEVPPVHIYGHQKLTNKTLYKV